MHACDPDLTRWRHPSRWPYRRSPSGPPAAPPPVPTCARRMPPVGMIGPCPYCRAPRCRPPPAAAAPARRPSARRSSAQHASIGRPLPKRLRRHSTTPPRPRPRPLRGCVPRLAMRRPAWLAPPNCHHDAARPSSSSSTDSTATALAPGVPEGEMAPLEPPPRQSRAALCPLPRGRASQALNPASPPDPPRAATRSLDWDHSTPRPRPTPRRPPPPRPAPARSVRAASLAPRPAPARHPNP